MKKTILGLSALCLVAFTSCKEDAASKVKAENVTVAAERDAVSGDFPAITFSETEHDFGEIENEKSELAGSEIRRRLIVSCRTTVCCKTKE